MESGFFRNVLRWSAYSTTSSESNIPSIIIEDAYGSDDQCAVNDNYLITFPEDDSDVDSAYDTRERAVEEVDSENDLPKKVLNRVYDNPLFIPASEVLKDSLSDGIDTEELMKKEAKKFEDYKYYKETTLANDFVVQQENDETVPIVYLSTSRAATLQRALRLGGFKKVGNFYIFYLL